MKKIASFLSLCVIAGLTMISCATTVSSKVTRPAQLNMNGATTIAVLPFQRAAITNDRQTSPEYKERQAFADYLSDELELRLADIEYYTVESSTRVKLAIEKGRPSPAEVYITGYVDYYTNEMNVTENKTKVDDEEVIEKVYNRSVKLELVYQIVDAKSNVVIHKDTEVFSESDKEYNQRNLKTAEQLINPRLDAFITKLLKKIQPYEETVSFTLLKDKSKNPDLKLADKLAKNGQIAAACDKFLEVYESTGDFVAGYNGALLLQAQGDLYGARDIMTELANSTADKRAVKALKNIQSEINSAQKLEAQNASRQAVE